MTKLEFNDYMTSDINTPSKETDFLRQAALDALLAKAAESQHRQIAIDSLTKLNSMDGAGIGTTTSPWSKPSLVVTTTEKYFNYLHTVSYVDGISKSGINVNLLLKHILEFCSESEVDKLIALLTSNSDYLSRQGYKSINLKGD